MSLSVRGRGGLPLLHQPAHHHQEQIAPDQTLRADSPSSGSVQDQKGKEAGQQNVKGLQEPQDHAVPAINWLYPIGTEPDWRRCSGKMSHRSIS